jgi:hypothetical protein
MITRKALPRPSPTLCRPYVGFWWFRAKGRRPAIIRVYHNGGVKFAFSQRRTTLNEILKQIVGGGKLVRIEQDEV